MNFEGPEKKIELILKHPVPGLRSNETRRWDKVVGQSGASILSMVSTPEMDAYLLSESSLFVWDDRVLMITCGRTLLVDSVPAMLEFLPKDAIGAVFYERKNLMFPEAQLSDFEVDAARLAPFFSGKSYRFGPSNDDHLHLYFASPGPFQQNEKDVTFQILMSDIINDLTHSFEFKNGAEPGRGALRSLIRSLYPEMQFDDYCFSPDGYSLNAVSGRHYCSVHVTPQKPGSYVSFETNMPERPYANLITDVVSFFRPARYSLVLTSNVRDLNIALHKDADRLPPSYEMSEKGIHELPHGCTVFYGNFLKRR